MTVTVFTNPNNPQCEATEQELSKLGVRYVAVDLTQNPSTFEQIKNAGFKQIPVVISPNSSWSGHRPDLIRQLARAASRGKAVKHPDSRAPSPKRQCRKVKSPRQNPQQNPTAITEIVQNSTQSKAASRNIARPAVIKTRKTQKPAYMRPAVDGSIFMVWNRWAMKSSLKYVAKNCETGEFCATPAIREYQESSAINVITPSTKISAKQTSVNV